ncbi:MAG TPA: aminotransferase class IV [Vicinamibacterales bacterium]|nr:aminotransferase class IV [Vicinamibacterales bacterium]
MKAMFNVNGRLCRREEAVISVLDHGFLYGEGVYEVCRTYNRRLFLFDRHLRRMRASAGMLALPVPLSDEALTARVEETMAAAGASPEVEGPEAYVRILLTRGVGDLSYDPAACGEPSLVIIVRELIPPPTAIYTHGVRVSLVSVIRNHPDAIDPLIKSNNLLNNALAMQEALRRGAFEAVMRNHRRELAECSQSNLFIVRDDMVLTPPLESGLLAGITREFLFEIARDVGLALTEAVLRDEDLLKADEAFLTSTTREIVPIVEVDEHTIGSGRPGRATRLLLEAFRKRADALTRTPRASSAARS